MIIAKLLEKVLDFLVVWLRSINFHFGLLDSDYVEGFIAETVEEFHERRKRGGKFITSALFAMWYFVIFWLCAVKEYVKSLLKSKPLL